MAGLIMRRGPLPGVRFPVEGQLILGRHSKADVVIQDSGASRRHAAVVGRDGVFRLIDLGSTNGTCLNGKPIRGEAVLRDGDLVQIGGEVFEFALADAGSADLSTSTLETVPLHRQGNGARGSGPPGADLPRTLGKFILLELLGRGGMGEVYRARERDGGPDMAIKVIRSDIGRQETFLDFFHNREAVLAREVEHPNIIRIFEHGVTGDQHFLAMEYVPGESLDDRIRRGPVPFEEALEILRQTACGLAAAHRRGVVHSDIKPANIMILKDGRGQPAEGEVPSREGRDAAGVQLEFPETDIEVPGGRYEGALKEEIRRRLGDPSPDFPLDPPYLSRPAEMRFLWHYWEGLRESGGHCIIVEGEAGAGKDRLLSEFIQELGLPGSLPGAFVPPPARLHELDVSRIEGIPQLHARLYPERAPLERPTREAVDEILRALETDGGPSVVRILSLEHASPIACELLAGIARLLSQRPILVLATLETGSLRANDALAGLLRSGIPRTKTLYIQPLTEYQVVHYLQDLFREPLRQDRLAADLHRLTGGNMARLLETLRGFFLRGILKIDRPAGRVVYQGSHRQVELEEGKNLYERYLRYGKMERLVLERSAFIGPEFPFDTLLKLAEVDETALFFIVRDLCHQGFLQEPDRAWFRFTNEAFQRYLVEKAGPKDASRLHRNVAWLLEEVPRSPTPELLWIRASHWERSGDRAKAVRLLLEGAHLARSAYDADRARHIYQEILRIWRSLAADESTRRAVNEELRTWFHRDANWYEILGALGEEKVPVQVKITDFGISFKIQDEEAGGLRIEEHVPLGTPRYLAPERVRRESGGPKSDIFSLGIIAYEMLAGTPPFPGRKGSEAMRCNLLQGIPDPPLGNVPGWEGFQELFRGMVERDPALRWDSERVLHTIEKLQFDVKMGPDR